MGSSAQSTDSPTAPASLVDAERIAIYRLFFGSYDNGSKSLLNVVRTTVPFEADEGDLAGCMKSFSKTNSKANSVHIFPSSTFPSDKVRLIDPQAHKLRDPGPAIRSGESVDDAVNAGFASGVFTFSEIVFDDSHTHAAFNYTFHCGSLCGHGGTVVYIKAQGKWKPSKTSCGSWIS